MTLIEIRDLKKEYGPVRALRGISTTIPKGQIVGLLGPNGAGKTTTMKILVGYLLPSGGSARVAGIDVVEDPIRVQQKIGYLPENAPIYGEMLARDYLEFIGQIRGLKPSAVKTRIHEVAEECAIDRVLGRPISQLSKGYRQRVGLAGAILHDPEILILDEPTTGLDPNQIVDVRDLIRRMGATKTIILSTHILPEVEATCDRAVIIIEGSLRADGTLDELTRSQSQVVRLKSDDPTGLQEQMARIPGVNSIDATSGPADELLLRLGLDGSRDIGEDVFRLARDRGALISELRRDDKTLEQVFRELTERAVEPSA